MVGTKPTARTRRGTSRSRTHSLARSSISRHRRTREASEITRGASRYAFSNPILHVLPSCRRCLGGLGTVAHESGTPAATLRSMPPNPLLLRTGASNSRYWGVVMARRRTIRSKPIRKNTHRSTAGIARGACPKPASAADRPTASLKYWMADFICFRTATRAAPAAPKTPGGLPAAARPNAFRTATGSGRNSRPDLKRKAMLRKARRRFQVRAAAWMQFDKRCRSL